MLSVLGHRNYRHLFLAQMIALAGTGLATVALGLLAYDLANGAAGAVLGTALTIKMVAYVTIAPVASGLAERLPRRALLVSLDLIRASVALCLPFVSAIWQIYVLIFFLQASSAAFTPTFQATIPDVLPDEKTYTEALSLSRLAYDLENLASPMLAAALLAFLPYHSLFAGTAIGFLASALLVVSVVLPNPKPSPRRNFMERTMRGTRIYLATPRLRGLLAICLSVAASGAMVIVNTVVFVQGTLGRDEGDVALALAAFGGGSMLAALGLPRLLARYADRPVMLAGVLVLTLGLALGPAVSSFAALAALWFCLGIGYSIAQTPSGRLLRRSARPEDRPAVFAAHFALSHACWLVTYPFAGWFGAQVGLGPTFAVLAGVAAGGLVLAIGVWPADDRHEIEHRHDDLPADHPHLLEGVHRDGQRHAHAFMIDDLHPTWPSEGRHGSLH